MSFISSSSTKPSNKNNMINTIMNFLPDNRPITSIQIVEDYEKCPKNYNIILRSYDADADVDLYRENVIFGKKTSRYLCLSKTEGDQDLFIASLSVISEKDVPPSGYSLLSRTYDTKQKAWRKRQIVFKMAKRGSEPEAVTDIILCTKFKQAPEGFRMAGEVNGILVCFKSGPVLHRPPPGIPIYSHQETAKELQQNINRLSFNLSKSLYPNSNDYENINNGPLLKRPAPKPPVHQNSTTGTLSAHTEVDGVPFTLNPNFSGESFTQFQVPNFDSSIILSKLDYDFHLERQILCTTKTNKSNNPFFH